MKTLLFIVLLLASCSRKVTLPEDARALHIEEYSIVYARKLGWAGPAYYEYDVYKDGYFVSVGIPVANDSCGLRLRESNVRMVEFNVCNATKKVFNDNRKPLSLAETDSVFISSYADSSQIKKCTEKQVKGLVKRWNKANAIGYKYFGADYDYKVTVYVKGGVREFKVANYFITEDGNWAYQLKHDDFFYNLMLL